MNTTMKSDGHRVVEHVLRRTHLHGIGIILRAHKTLSCEEIIKIIIHIHHL